MSMTNTDFNKVKIFFLFSSFYGYCEVGKILVMQNEMSIFLFYPHFKKYFIFHHHGNTKNTNFHLVGNR